MRVFTFGRLVLTVFLAGQAIWATSSTQGLGSLILQGLGSTATDDSSSSGTVGSSASLNASSATSKSDASNASSTTDATSQFSALSQRPTSLPSGTLGDTLGIAIASTGSNRTPLSTGTGSSNAAATTTLSSLQNATTTIFTPPGSAVVGNATFATSCPRSNMACWSTCTSYASVCESLWSDWLDIGQTCSDPVSTYAYTTYTSTYTNEYTSYKLTIVNETETQVETATTQTIGGHTYTFVATTETVPWIATYALDQGTGYSTLVSTFRNTFSSTVCEYSVPPPTCTFYDGGLDGSCKLGPDCNDCTIYGGTVQLLYFPASTAILSFPNATTSIASARTGSPTPTAAASLATYQGTTLTSPSVYISFQTVYAVDDCNSTVGQAHTGSILALDPTDLSSALGNWHARITDISDLAEGKTDVSLYAEPFTLADLNWPYPPWVWAEQERCNDFIAMICPVIISGQYNPVLAVPTQIRNMDPAWATCAVDLQGLYDPPTALSPIPNIASATVPVAGGSTSTPAAAPAGPTTPGPSATATPVPESTTVVVVFSSTSASDPDETSPSPAAVLPTTSASDPDETPSTAGSGQTPPADGQRSTVPAQSSQDQPTTPTNNGGTSKGDPGSEGAGPSDPTSPTSNAGGSGASTAGPAPIATIGSGSSAVTIVSDPTQSAQVIAQSAGGSATLAAGATGSAGGHAFSVGSSGVVVAVSASTVDLGGTTAPSNAAPASQVGLVTIVQASSGQGVVIDSSQALEPGQKTVLTGDGQIAVTVSAVSTGGVAVASQGSTVVLDPGSGSSIGSGIVISGPSPGSDDPATEPATTFGGTTYSALSSGGVVAVVNGQTSTIAAGTSPVTIAPGVVITPIDQSITNSNVASGFVVAGQTITAGGPAETVSGATFSALPSGGGIVVASDGHTSTIATGTSPVTIAPGIVITPLVEQSIVDGNTATGFVIAGQTITAGGPAGTVSGTTFSALPSGSGIVEVSNGHTTTLTDNNGSPITVAPNVVFTPLPASGPSSVAVVNGHTFSRVSDGIVIDGTATLMDGSSTTTDGMVFSINSNGRLIIEGSTTFGAQQTPGLGELLNAVESAATASGVEQITPNSRLTTTLKSGQSQSATPSMTGATDVVGSTSASVPVSTTKKSAGSTLSSGMSIAVTVSMALMSVSLML